MLSIPPNPSLLSSLPGKTALVTGGANGIGLATIQLLHFYGANVIIADLESARPSSEAVLDALLSPRIPSSGPKAKAVFIPCDITSWASLTTCFNKAVELYERIDIVVANAGIMESGEFWELDNVDEWGVLRENREARRVLDVNLMGTMNTLRIALFHLRTNPPNSVSGSRGSVILVSSISGYFGSSGVVSYVSSKHGITGLLRSSQKMGDDLDIKINAVAPFMTATHITSSYAERWKNEGLPDNTVDDVAGAIVQTALEEWRGKCCMIAGGKMVELERPREEFMEEWLGEEMFDMMKKGGKFFKDVGGYPLPKPARGDEKSAEKGR